MRRMTIGAVLTAALLAGPAAVTAEAQTPVAIQAATAQVTQTQAQDDDDKKDDDGGGWGLWGLAGLLGLLGLIPRRQKTRDTGTYRGTGSGSHPTDRP
ncbi:MAG TPA: WGxxGxxG family protein [Streptomyces sp.]|uniref:WGxxGxxG family protein n=1 Tax=Streptomyces sp. TaxID=1931 RepID=UPI002CB76DB8|nr:WGxxGxxG family protein [Streptomyces sp.]HWU08790.1 WGxxGxxG family protein [Streptomyces sp.]